jgi:ectoine hydroxylase-related dioxygenase (phytanoyl-CoA dioxygenase family)
MAAHSASADTMMENFTLPSSTRESLTFELALGMFGVSDDTLNKAEKQALDTTGYTVLEGVLSKEQLTHLRQLFDETARNQSQAGPDEKESGTRHLKDLHRSEAFWRVPLHPRILAAAFRVLGRRFICSIPHGREPLQGFGQQGLHMDWRTAAHAGVFYVATAICLLDEFTAENGATRVVPGSHRNAELPNKKISDPAFIHPDQVTVIAPAGSVLFFNGHLLHSATRNRTSLRRRTLQFSFLAFDVRHSIMGSGEQAAAADPAARLIFGYENIS